MKPRTKYLLKRHAHLVAGYPSCGPNPNITGIRKLVYGPNALLVKCGQYVYNVPKEVYDNPLCK